MAKYLIVAHQTAASPELIRKLQEIDAEDPAAEFTLLVPASSTAHLLIWVEGESEQIARRRAEEASIAFSAAGLHLTRTVIGDANPMRAIEAESRQQAEPYAMTVIGMLQPGLSHWLRRDLQHRAQARLPMPVVVIYAGQAAPKAGSAVGTQAVDDLSEPVPLSLQQFAQRQGQKLECIDGDVGRMQEVLYDYLTGTPLWVGVFAHAYSVRPLLVPARAVQSADGRLWTRLSKQQVLDQPPINLGEGFCSLSEEEAICRYFGLPFDDIRDTRVLRRNQEFPGLERNEQHILRTEGNEVTGRARAA
jgi:hypothetical protein